MNFLSLFVLIPLLMMLGLWIARDMKQIRTVAVIGSTILLALSVYTLVEFLAERAAGNTATMLFTDSRMWYAPLNIHYAVGVDGVSVAMLLLSSIIVFAAVTHRRVSVDVFEVGLNTSAERSVNYTDTGKY